MPIQFTAPRVVAGHEGAPWILDDARRVPARWVRPRRRCLDPPSAGTPLVSRVGTGSASSERTGEAALEQVSC